jgi:hypothetical protein
MKAIACYALHYGAEYLPWSIRSIESAVDEIHVFYTPVPSYGFSAGVPCPESESLLQGSAHRFLKDKSKLVWHVGHWNGEGHHREAFLTTARARKADLVLVVDADEMWPEGAARVTLENIYRENRAGRWLCRFQNFWRSFGWEIRDGFRPIRVVDLRHPIDKDAHTEGLQVGAVYHFGYAQALSIMAYKWTCHGHQSELRPGWYDAKFLPWTPYLADHVLDLHPTVNNLWNKAYEVTPDVRAEVDRLLYDHPNHGKGLIA